MSSTSSFVVGDKKKEFSFEFFKYESNDMDVFEILLRFFATDVNKLLKWFEIVRSPIIVSLSIFRLILEDILMLEDILVRAVRFLKVTVRVTVRFLKFLNDSYSCFLLSGLFCRIVCSVYFLSLQN